MPSKSKVVISRCCDYQDESLKATLDQLLRHLGGMEKFVQPGEKVLIKVNLLSPKSPEKAVTTHPALVKQLIKSVLSCGGKPIVGDSSGGMMKGKSSTSRALDISGIRQAAEEAGAEVANFDQEEVIQVPNIDNPIASEFRMSKVVHDADTIICMPKLKTHTATLFTGAIKNMFGTIPGYQKAEYHRIAPKLEDFSKILVDIYQHAKPDLVVMDGILAMEGPGPAHGHPYKANLLLASADGVALDAVASKIMGFDPSEIATTRIAQEHHLGEGRIDNIDIRGLSVEEAMLSDFSLPSQAILSRISPFWIRRGLGMLKARPHIIKEKCVRCGFCRENCPVQVISMEDGFPEIDQKRCIKCYCCQELCPEGAVVVQYDSLLLRAYMRLMSKKST